MIKVPLLFLLYQLVDPCVCSCHVNSTAAHTVPTIERPWFVFKRLISGQFKKKYKEYQQLHPRLGHSHLPEV